LDVIGLDNSGLSEGRLAGGDGKDLVAAVVLESLVAGAVPSFLPPRGLGSIPKASALRNRISSCTIFPRLKPVFGDFEVDGSLNDGSVGFFGVDELGPDSTAAVEGFTIKSPQKSASVLDLRFVSSVDPVASCSVFRLSWSVSCTSISSVSESERSITSSSLTGSGNVDCAEVF
jgi:hypothetical protein